VHVAFGGLDLELERRELGREVKEMNLAAGVSQCQDEGLHFEVTGGLRLVCYFSFGPEGAGFDDCVMHSCGCLKRFELLQVAVKNLFAEQCSSDDSFFHIQLQLNPFPDIISLLNSHHNPSLLSNHNNRTTIFFNKHIHSWFFHQCSNIDLIIYDEFIVVPDGQCALT
jgi:hypothetical protein